MRQIPAVFLLAPLCLYAETAQISSLAPDVELYPGDRVNFDIRAVFGGQQPNNANVARYDLKEVSTKGERIIASQAVAARTGSATITGSYNVPQQYCFECPGRAYRITNLELTVTLLTASNGAVLATSPARIMTVKYPTISGASPSTMPLQTEVTGANVRVQGFAPIDPNGSLQLYYRHVGTNQSATSFSLSPGGKGTVCPTGELSASAGRYFYPCNATVSSSAINFDFFAYFMDGSQAANVALGSYDIIFSAPAPVRNAPINLLNPGLPDAILPSGFTLTAPRTDDSTNFKRLSLSSVGSGSVDLALGTENISGLAPGALANLTVYPEFKLSREGYGILWGVVRDKNTRAILRAQDKYVVNTRGLVSTAAYAFNLGNFPVFFTVPPVDSTVEIYLAYTPLMAKFDDPYDESRAFAKSPVVTVTFRKPGDVAIDHIEVVQVVQNDKNEVPLIAGKNTVARVFLKVEPKTADPVGNVSVKLTSGNTGAARKLNASITVVGEPDRDKFEHSINFALPKDWIKEGELSLEAEVVLPAGFTDTKMDNNKKTAKVQFVETPFKDRQFTVRYVPFCYQPKPDVAKRCPQGRLNTFGVWFQQLYPFAEGRVSYARLDTSRPTIRYVLTSGSASKLMADLNRFYSYYEEKRPGKIDQVVGWVPRVTDAPADPRIDRALPLGRANSTRVGGTGRVAFMQDTSNYDMTLVSVDGVGTGQGKDPRDPIATITHEVGHNYSLRHPATADSCGSGDATPDWPKDAAGNPLPSTIGEPGFDTVARTVMPKKLKDVMTYCSPPTANFWISPRHYQKLLTALKGGVPSGASTKPESQGERQALRSAEGAAVVIVGGSARRDGSAGNLDPIMRLAAGGGTDASAPLGNHCLVFRNEAGPLGRHCFQLNFVDDDPHEATTAEPILGEEYFSFRVALPEGTTQIDLEAGTAVLASLKAGAGVPTVSITSPQAGEQWAGGGTRTLSWTASAAGGGPLTYAALYSNDGGTTWSPLDVNITDTQIEIDTTELSGGTNVFFRVIASSGFDSSETTVGPVELAQAPKIEVPSEVVDFGHVLVGLDAEKRFELKSSGNGPLMVNGVAASGDAGFTVVSPEEAFPLPATESEDVALRFIATRAGVQTATVEVASNDPSTPTARVGVRARAVDTYIPEIAISPAALAFGTVSVGQSRELPLTVKNVGSALLTVSSVSVSSATLTIAGGSRFTLEPGAQQVLTVLFRPTTGAAVNSTLTIASDDRDRPSLQLPVTGAGVAPASPSIAVSPSILEFASIGVGSTKELPLTVSNTGNAELSVTAVSSNNTRFTIVSPAVPFRVASGSQQTVTIRFAPTAAQSEAGQLTITSNDPARPSATVSLSGAGAGVTVPTPSIAVPQALDFGSTTVGQPKDASVTVRNSGSATLSVTGMTVTGAQFALVGAPALPLSIAAGAQQVLNLRMTPVAAGAQTGELRLASNDPARASAVVTLAGSATASAVTNPAPLLDSFVPATVTAGEGPFLLTVTGSRLVSGTTVNWNGTARPTTFVNSTQVRATISAADIATPGTGEITLTSPGPGGGTASGKPLTIAAGGGATVLVQQIEGESCPLLTAHVSGIDRLGNTITSLSSANFRCTEDGQPVNCTAEPSSAAGIGLSVAFVIDTSASSGDLGAEKAAATAAISHLAADDRVALIQADATAVPVGGFTANRTSTSGALAALGGTGSANNAIFDAIEVAVRNAAAQTGRRKAVVVFTGSENTAGTIRDSAVMLNSARAAGVPVYVLSFSASANSATATAAMQQLALDTAGRFTATNGNLQLQAERTGQILANQHSVSWSTPNKDGAFHLFGLTLSSSQGSAVSSVFYRSCR
jgi:VWFA-related protein